MDSDFIDWAGLAAETAAVVCTVRQIEEPRDYGNGEVVAVRARVIVLTGSQAGAVFPDERILKAGIRNKLTQVGDDVVGRLSVYGTRKAVGLEAERDGDIPLAEAALAKANGNGVPDQRKSGEATAKAAAPAEAEEPPF